MLCDGAIGWMDGWMSPLTLLFNSNCISDPGRSITLYNNKNITKTILACHYKLVFFVVIVKSQSSAGHSGKVSMTAFESEGSILIVLTASSYDLT